MCTDFSGKAEAADDLQEVQWFEINELPDMKLDGNELIKKAYKEICLHPDCSKYLTYSKPSNPLCSPSQIVFSISASRHLR